MRFRFQYILARRFKFFSLPNIVILEISQVQKTTFAKGHPNRFRNGREKGVPTGGHTV